MGRIFNVLAPVVVLSVFFQDGFGLCTYGNSCGPVTGIGGFNGGAAGNGAFFGYAESGGPNGGAGDYSGPGNGYGFMNTGDNMASDGPVYGSGYNGNGFYGNFGNGGGGYGYPQVGGMPNGGGSFGYSQGGGMPNGGGGYGYPQGGGMPNGGGSFGYFQGGGSPDGGSNVQYGSNVVYGGRGGTIQRDSYPSRSFISEMATGIADTVVDAIEVGQSLMHRPHVRQSYVRHSRPGYVRQVLRVPGRMVTVHRGCRY